MKISSLFREAQKGPALSLDQDLMQRAMLRFPGYDSQQALSLYIADKATQQQKTDAAQNNLINTQQNAIKSIGQELQDYEAQAQETDREVERLKQLSGTLTTGSAERQQKAKVSADELEKLQKDLEDLKSKPGMDPEKFQQLEAQIISMANNPAADDSSVQKIHNLLAKVQQKQSIGDEQLNMLLSKLQDTEKELENKELRFQKSLNKNAEKFDQNASEFRKYADIVDGYKEKIDNFDNEIEATTAKIQQDAKDANEVLNIIKTLYNTAKDKVDPNAPSVPINQQAANDQGTSGQPIAPIDPSFLDQYTGTNVDKTDDDSDEYEGDLYGRQKKFAESVNIVEYEKSPPKIYKDWGDPAFNDWMKDHLAVLIKLFKFKYQAELSNKSPTYGDGQISYDIQEEAWFLKKIFDNKQDSILTKEKMDNYLKLVKRTLFSQPVEISHQDDLPLRENLHKTYERMLDNIIGLPYIKG